MGDEADTSDAVARELRQRLGPQLRAEAEESERLAAQSARRKRSLVDVTRDLMARGDTVSVAVPGRRITGVIVHAAGDLATLRTPGGEVDVNLRALAHLRVDRRAPAGGAASSDGPSSFKARLFEVELAGRPVEIGSTTVGEGQLGTVEAVGVDHIVWHDRDGGEWFLPLAQITHLIRRSSA